MAQKDKVKELVGRGLHSYHTKALQQIDRIEKKNKEQNHKISILSNELDNDYLTKTEEGSVISLEHSKEGMVYLDELQGNTLVNYCTDGSKEITLNGDIDVEGTFVTTTEGVDNGKVDVMCEGNTLVNLVSKMWSHTQAYYTIDENYITILDSEIDHRQDYYTLSGGQLNLIKPNTTYTIIAEITKNTLQRNFTLINNYQANQGDITSDGVSVPTGFVGRYVGKFTTLSDFTNRNRLGFNTGSGNRGEITLRNNFIILEGDWTNRDIPASYFKGMKSVGQDDENGHKIEILSQNKNLVNCSKLAVKKLGVEYTYRDNMIYINGTTVGNYENSYYVSVENMITGEEYTLSYETNNENKAMAYAVFSYYDNNAKKTMYRTRNATFTWQSYYQDAKVYIQIDNAGTSFDNIWYKVQLEKNVNATQYVPYNSNKKEILMNEPLRSLPHGVKDKFIKQGSKWYIERNCGEELIDGSSESAIVASSIPADVLHYGQSLPLAKVNQRTGTCPLADKLPRNTNANTTSDNFEGVYIESTSNLRLMIAKTKLSTYDKNGLISYLQQNPIRVVYQLATPTYEEITDAELITYLDTTHISNNSTIPCTMKVKNSGYNAIIKPSTLYTIALDTNKSGTIGMDLGGVKGTTTNNVLKLTTPATLADDSLRLYGKGIKGSKVRILEGDKTNWIPSHFEGMKSSFEDKFDATNNTYKMEILSNNKNVLNLSKHDGITTYTHHGVTFSYNDKTQEFTVNGTATQDLGYQSLLYSNDRFVTFEQGKNYTLSTTAPIPFTVQISERNVISALTLHPNTMFRNTFDRQNANYCSAKMNYFMIWGISAGDTFNNLKFKLQIEEGSVKTEYIPNKQNKIQFLLDEPLRKIDDILKDKFTFKNGKLMIERNCIEKTLDGSETWYNDGEVNNGYLCCFINDTSTNMSNYSKRTFKCNILPYEGEKRFNCEQATRSGAGFLEFILKVDTNAEFRQKISELRPTVIVGLEEPTYEEIPFELQKIILEGYENGTLFLDTNIPPTATVKYAGETPIIKATKLNKTEVSSNTEDINDNIIPYLMDMDYRVVMLQLATEESEGGVSMARLFGGTYEMIKRDILSKRLSRQEYGYRLADYYNVGKLTEEQVRELEELR